MTQEIPTLIKKPRPNSSAARAVELATNSDSSAGAEQFRAPIATNSETPARAEATKRASSTALCKVGGYVTDDIRRRFHLLAVSQNTTMSKVIEQSIIDYLDKHKA